MVIDEKPCTIYTDKRGNRNIEDYQSLELNKPTLKLIKPNINNKCNETNGLTQDQLNRLDHLLKNHVKVFKNQYTITNVYEHKINVNQQNKFDSRVYNIPANYKQQVEVEIKKMLDNKIIERADSTFLNPMVAIKKKK